MDIKSQKKEAVAFINKHGRRVELVFYGLILVFVAVTPVFLFNYTSYFVSSLIAKIFSGMTFKAIVATLLSAIGPAGGLIVAVLFGVFVTFPVTHAFFRCSYKLYRDGVTDREGLLTKRNGGYFSALRAGFIECGVVFIALLPVIGSVVVSNLLIKRAGEAVASLVIGLFVFIVLASLVLGFCLFLLFKPIFLFGYFSARSENMRSALKKSCKIMKKKESKKLYFAYIKSFLPSLLLALPTFLILFFIDTLPKMIIVYHRLADELVYSDKT